MGLRATFDVCIVVLVGVQGSSRSGKYVPRHYGAILEKIDLPNSTLAIASNIPARFDAREQWPQCASVIGRIRDQSDCGSCWAFGTTTAFNDRLCIATGKHNIVLSPWDTLTNAGGQFGCGGGNPSQAWQWLSSTGVVTGGDSSDVGKGTSCQPYEFGFCNHHEASKNYQMCPPPNCPGGCKLPSGSTECTEQSYASSYTADKHRAASSYYIHGEAQMQTEIMTYGPITVGFDVYQNWEFYRGGVYSSTDATALMGGHAVKIIGWGECTDCKARYICHSINAAVPDSWCLTNCLLAHPYNCPEDTCLCDPGNPPSTDTQNDDGATPTPYWLVVNSWNEDWGEKGFFRMLRGSNVCGFEGEHVSAGHAISSSTEVVLSAAGQNVSSMDVKFWKKRCGSALTWNHSLPARSVDISAAIPEEFDAREQWPQCPSVGRIRDQSECGSCWAISATEAFNDRLCIATGDAKVVLSAADTTACAPGAGCGGGQPADAWAWFASKGVVTGGAYETSGSGATCMPYPFPECAHHTNSTKYKPCPRQEYPTPQCGGVCTDTSYPNSYSIDKHRMQAAYALVGESDIQAEIMARGPTTATYTVYDGMPQYKYGVYVHGNGAELGGHAVKIIGWGLGHTACYSVTAAVPDIWCGRNCASGSCPEGTCRCDANPPGKGTVPYWLIANSWNAEWGDRGTFKILRGANECGIEQNVYAAAFEPVHLDGQGAQGQDVIV